MTKLTIVYTDGYEEHYNMIPPKNVNDSNRLQRFNDILENDVLKLIIDDKQIVIIPIANIRKILSQIDDETHVKMKEYPGFMNVTVAE